MQKHDAYLWMYWISKTPYQDQGRCHDDPGWLIYPIIKCDPLRHWHGQYAFDRWMPVNTSYRLFFAKLKISEGLVFLEWDDKSFCHENDNKIHGQSVLHSLLDGSTCDHWFSIMSSGPSDSQFNSRLAVSHTWLSYVACYFWNQTK